MTPPLVFDVGLHRGEDTEFYLKKGYRVVAFEANPGLVEQCSRSFSAALSSGQLTICTGVVKATAQPGEVVNFFVDPHTSVWGTASDTFAERNRRLGHETVQIVVPVVGLVEAIRQFGVPHYIKSDIEGLDHEVLSALELVESKPQFISLESEKMDFSALVNEIRRLQRLGYRRFKAVQQASIPGRLLRTRTVDDREMEHRFSEHASGPFGDDLNGRWLTADQVLRRYRRIFLSYSLVGDLSPGERLLGRWRLDRIQSWLGYPLPGWYDTHARLD